jgi:hypothetical protein
MNIGCFGNYQILRATLALIGDAQYNEKGALLVTFQ